MIRFEDIKYIWAYQDMVNHQVRHFAMGHDGMPLVELTDNGVVQLQSILRRKGYTKWLQDHDIYFNTSA